METLPAWLQWLVAIASILSSVGVIIAFVQLKISSKQFDKQLKISTEQFRLVNQGFVKMTTKQLWLQHGQDLTADPTKPLPLDMATPYFGGRLIVNLENVGNIPVKFMLSHLKILIDGREVSNVSGIVDTIHPKTSDDYVTVDYTFANPATDMLLPQIAALNISYQLLIEYNDYNQTGRYSKTIDRELQLIGGIIYNVRMDDKL